MSSSFPASVRSQYRIASGAGGQAQAAPPVAKGAAIVYFVAAVVLAIIAAVVVAVLLVVVRTKGQLQECFFVSFAHIPNNTGTIPESQVSINDTLKAMQCSYASYGQLLAAHTDGAQWCQAGFFDLDLATGLISGVGWPNHVAAETGTCGAVGINYIAVPVVSPPNGGPKAADLAHFAGTVTGFIAYGLKPNAHNINPPGSILPFAPDGRWSQYDSPQS